MAQLTLQTHFEPETSFNDKRTEYLRLETVGRKSLRPHQVLLRFIVVGQSIIVFPQNTGKQDWITNLRANSNSKVYTENGVFSSTAQIRQISSTKDPILSLFARKYGAEIVNQRYWGQHTYVELRVTRVETGSLNNIIYDDLEAAFDGVAANYDRHIFGNPINTWLRNISTGTLKHYFAAGNVVLEIGCGTGTETLSLARQGVTVLAYDISKRMLDVLWRKAQEESLQDRILPIHCRTDELEDRVHELGFGKIDGAYSTYGAINTEPRLNLLFQELHGMLKPNGTLILGVWNKFCLYELIGYLLRGKPTLAFARLRNPVPIGRSRFCIKSNAYSVGMLAKHVRSLFNLESVLGVVILLPPSNLTRYIPRGRMLDPVKSLDLILGRVFPFNRLGDHFLAVYTARGTVSK